MDISAYEQQAINRNLPLTSGIGSPQIDRNSIEDLDAKKAEFAIEARKYLEAIKRVCETVALPEDNHVAAPWPSHIYFEDVNGQSQFELVEIILNEAYNCAPFERRAKNDPNFTPSSGLISDVNLANPSELGGFYICGQGPIYHQSGLQR